jgi:hypothetical protein
MLCPQIGYKRRVVYFSSVEFFTGFWLLASGSWYLVIGDWLLVSGSASSKKPAASSKTPGIKPYFVNY